MNIQKNPITMVIAEFPVNEERRLADLVSYDMLNDETAMDLDNLSAIMSTFFNCPIALVTLIDKNRQWFKGKSGTTETGNTRALSFCSHTLLHNEIMVVEDTLSDERFFDNPFVKGTFQLRFYAGVPITSANGYALGTVCIYDFTPRKISPEQILALQLFSKQAATLLELRRQNILLRQRSAEIIELKNRSFAYFIKTLEEDKKEISYSLHEDIAQHIAAVLINLQMINHTESSDLVKKTIEQLKEVLIKIRSLSYTITPSIFSWLDTFEILNQLIEQIKHEYDFTISIEQKGELKEMSPENMVCAVRVITQWLKVLSKKEAVSNVIIKISYNEQFKITIEDDGAIEDLNERKKEVFASIVYDRVHVQGGSVEIFGSKIEKNLLKVLLPFAKQ